MYLHLQSLAIKDFCHLYLRPESLTLNLEMFYFRKGGLTDWLIDWIVFYAVSAIFQPYNDGGKWWDTYCICIMANTIWVKNRWYENKSKIFFAKNKSRKKDIELFHRYLKKHVLVNVELHVLDFIDAGFSTFIFSCIYNI